MKGNKLFTNNNKVLNMPKRINENVTDNKMSNDKMADNLSDKKKSGYQLTGSPTF